MKVSSSLQPKNLNDINRSRYSFPQRFKIGRKRTDAPLVNTAQVKGHLALLRAFTELRSRIDALDEKSKDAVPFMPEDKDKRWVWFVGFAVERFTTWCESLTPDDSATTAQIFLPPLDVLMVWHAYMLNPGWYAEDCIRLPIVQNLAEIDHIFASSLASGFTDILASEPHSDRLTFWDSRTHRPFDPLEDARKNSTKKVQCPYCRRTVEIAYLDTKGQGYFQGSFHLVCVPGDFCCRPSWTLHTRRIFGVRKFAEDLVREDGTPRSYLAGTLRTPEKSADEARAREIKNAVLLGKGFTRPSQGDEEQWIVSIMEKMLRTHDVKRLAMPPYMQENAENMVCRIHSAYADDRPFSVELVGAVIRQGSFVKKMRELKWTEPAFLDNTEEEAVLQHAIARYHAFLDLMASSSNAFYVPTLDIDLAWHTHQLMGEKYNSDCMTYIGHYVDHDDTVVEHKLASSFDATSRDWNTRFGLPYTHCGCPPPGKTLRQRLSLLLHLPTLLLGSPTRLVPPAPSPSKTGVDPDPDPDPRAATHPSEHNSILYLPVRQLSPLFPPSDRHPADVQWAREKKLVRRQARQERTLSCTTPTTRKSNANAVGGPYTSCVLQHGPTATATPPPFLFPLSNAYYQDKMCVAHDGRYVRGPGEGALGMSACAAGGTVVPREVVRVKPTTTNTKSVQKEGKGREHGHGEKNRGGSYGYGGTAASASGGAALSAMSVSSCGASGAGGFGGFGGFGGCSF